MENEPDGNRPTEDNIVRRRIRAARRLLVVLRPYRSSIVLLGLTSAVAVLFETLTLVLIVPLASTASSGADSYSFDLLSNAFELSTWTLVLLAVALIALRSGFNLLNAQQEARLLARFEREQRQRGFRAFVRSSWERQASEGPGGLQNLIGSIVTRSLTAIRSLTAAVVAGTGLLIMLAGAFVSGGLAALAIIGAIAFLMAIVSPALARSRRHARHLLDLSRRFAHDVEESTTMTREIRIYGAQDPYADHLDETIVPYEHHRARNQFWATTGAGLFETGGLLLVVGALAALYLSEPDGATDFGVMALLMLRGLMYGRQLNSQLQAGSDALPFAVALEHDIRSFENATPPNGTSEISAVDRVGFRGVSFAYAPGQPVLQDVTVDITAGDSVGVIGPSGSGKSTFVELLLLLRPPLSGTVEVNGVASSTIELGSWYDRVNLVPQHPNLFRGSVLENIRFFRPGLTDEECVEAARRAHIHDEIITLRDGYQHSTGERGAGLSGGQRQRICIARALAGRPDLIVFDEPTSSLDAHSEHAIQSTMADLQSNTTMIIVAHRLSTLRFCNKLLVLEDGRVQAFGPREEIEQNSDYYADILRVSEML
ncbi:ABC transporter ATP-binding protein [Nocardioides sp.]|uniref:ABC transporter ATP-binding protein n=1 Tax=Nocardioides sp. TaxID=35761 RepID=UPI003563239F